MLRGAGHFLFKHRNAMFPVACVLLFLPGPDPFPDPMLAAGIGAFIAACGQFMRAATIGLKYVVRGGRGGRVYAEDLVTDGLYAHSRNPMYVGNLLIMLGLAVASNNWPTIAIAVPLGLFMYSAIVAAEEDYLQQRFGAAFSQYCRDVPRWLPRFAGLGETLASMQFRWRRLVVKEYGTPFGWISILVVISLYNLWTSGLWSDRPLHVRFLQDVLIVAVIAWFIAWFLKRTRRLVAD
jgi:protein-S-isoprenylcysteine O-methyltransferase Ste14